MDDIGVCRKVMRKSIEHQWPDITEAYDGSNALEAVKQADKDKKPFDVIFMDYQMPNMDGPEAAKILRETGYQGYIVGVTGNGAAADIKFFISMGADKVLIKPVQVYQLEQCLEGN